IKNNGKVDAELIHEAQLQWQWRQSKVRLVGLEVLARMRLKHDRAGLGAKPAGLGAGGLGQCLGTPMHPIEVPERKRSAACRCWNIIAAVEDTHGAGIAALHRLRSSTLRAGLRRPSRRARFDVAFRPLS